MKSPEALEREADIYEELYKTHPQGAEVNPLIIAELLREVAALKRDVAALQAERHSERR